MRLGHPRDGSAALLKRRVLAVDNDPWSVRVTRQNAGLNGCGVTCRRGWAMGGRVRMRRAFDLILANILARPLCLMARHLAAHANPGCTIILAGLLVRQVPMVLAAHRRVGLRLEAVLREGEWATMVLRR